MELVFYGYLIVIGVLSAAITIWDKHRARNGGWRIPERTLFLLSLLGGSAPMLLTMLLIRHKTRHRSFMLGLPAMILAQTAVAAALYYFL